MEIVQNIKIQTNQELKFECVASFRKKMISTEIQHEVSAFIDTLKNTGAKKNGPMISATFGVEVIEGIQYLDMEFLVPIKSYIELPSPYLVKPIFHLINAIHVRHYGSISTIEKSFNCLQEYIQVNRLQQITAAYNVNINDINDANDEETIMDIYIGVSYSIL